MAERHELWQIADGLQMDLRAASAKLVELRAKLASLDLPEPSHVTCPVCDVAKRGARTLAEHMYQLHDGPVPEHYATVERLMDEPPDEEPDLAARTDAVT